MGDIVGIRKYTFIPLTFEAENEEINFRFYEYHTKEIDQTRSGSHSNDSDLENDT